MTTQPAALHDVTQDARRTGIRVPVAFTAAAWSAAVAFSPTDHAAITERRTDVLTVVATHLFGPDIELPIAVRVRPMLYPLGPRISDWIDLEVRHDQAAPGQSHDIVIALPNES